MMNLSFNHFDVMIKNINIHISPFSCEMLMLAATLLLPSFFCILPLPFDGVRLGLHASCTCLHVERKFKGSKLSTGAHLHWLHPDKISLDTFYEILASRISVGDLQTSCILWQNVVVTMYYYISAFRHRLHNERVASPMAWNV